MAASQHMPTILAIIDTNADGTDDACLHNRWKSWMEVALTTGILQNIDMLGRLPAVAAILPGDGMQRRLYRSHLPTIRTQHPTTVLRARLSHWGVQGPDLVLVVWFAELRLRQCAMLKLPATILWSLLRLWCNTLPTSRIFAIARGHRWR